MCFKIGHKCCLILGLSILPTAAMPALAAASSTSYSNYASSSSWIPISSSAYVSSSSDFYTSSSSYSSSSTSCWWCGFSSSSTTSSSCANCSSSSFCSSSSSACCIFGEDASGGTYGPIACGDSNNSSSGLTSLPGNSSSGGDSLYCEEETPCANNDSGNLILMANAAGQMPYRCISTTPCGCCPTCKGKRKDIPDWTTCDECLSEPNFKPHRCRCKACCDYFFGAKPIKTIDVQNRAACRQNCENVLSCDDGQK